MGVAQKPAAAGKRVVAPPLASLWVEPSRWRPLVKFAWNKDEHINVRKSRTVLNYARHLARSSSRRQTKCLVSTDSTVAIGALSKGRSSAPTLRFELRRASALTLAGDWMCNYVYVPSAYNPADAPSRGKTFSGCVL